jgi:UDP-2,3-diacylglucosamine pyrophosphatase LpxH
VKTTAHESRLLVISDIHMGNRLHRTREEFTEFVHFALEHRYSICINGDGIDLAQLSLAHLVSDITPSLGLFLKFGDNDLRVYYTVGNHDIALEHFLTGVGRMMVVPFLSVTSGDKRIRIEHGHMYDDMFLRFPRIYFVFTLIGRFAIAISPGFYDALHRFNSAFVAFSEWALSGFGLMKKKKKKKDETEEREDRIVGERECFRAGADASGSRGFDAVLFGHTHFQGTGTLMDGVKYYNTGAWFGDPYCVAIHDGQLWFGSVADLVRNGDPFPQSTSDVVRAITGVYPVQQSTEHRFTLTDQFAATPQ